MKLHLFALKFLGIFTILLTLSACGGGGGGGGSSDGISVDTSAISFTAERNGALPATQSFAVKWSNPNVAGVVVGVPPSQSVPSWISISLQGSSSPLTLNVSVNTTNLAAGTYTMTLRLVSGDSNANVINTIDIPVSYTVKNVVGATPNQLSYSYVLGDATLPASQSISLSGTGINWTASADQNWLKLGNASGTTPVSLPVSVDPSGMAVGSYQATVTITNTSDPSNVLQIPINFTINQPTLSLSTGTLNFSYVYGSSVMPAGMSVTLSGYQINWTATSTDSWVLLDANKGTGNTDLTVNADISGLSPGVHTASITFTNDNDNTDAVMLSVTIDVALPTLNVSTTTVSLGGSDGKTQAPVSANFSLNTGSNAYPWTITFDTGTNGNWLQADVTSGNVTQATAQTVNLSADTSLLSGGMYSGSATVSVDVNGQVIAQSILVSLAYEPRRIYVNANGEAFVSTPSISRLTDNVMVQDSYATTSIPWSAKSDQNWLSVTASGNTGDQLTLTADPSGLSTDVIHYANVTISSSDSTIVNTETIRVGFWVGSTDPNAADSLALTYTHIVADPIRPYVYVNNGGTNIDVYNVYTPTLVTTIPNVATMLGGMTVSRDGSTLYAIDQTSHTIVPVDLDAQSVGTPWSTGTSSPYGIAMTRIESHDIVITTNRAYNANTDTAYMATFILSSNIATSLNGTKACGVDQGLSPYTLYCMSMVYSSLNGGLVVTHNPNTLAIDSNTSFVGSNGMDVALSHDGTYVYVASGAPYGLAVFNTDTLAYLQTVATDAYPNNAEVGIDGHIYTASFSWYGPKDVWVFDAGLNPLGDYYLSGYAQSIRDRQMVVSGDGKRIIVSTDDPTLQFVTAP